MPPSHRRTPISEAHARLGSALRVAREGAGLTTRQVPKDGSSFYSSGHISLVEAGAVAASPELVGSYATVGGDGAELRSLHEQVLAAARNAGRIRRQGRQAGPVVAPPRDARAVLDRREVQQHYVVVTQEARYRFASSGAIADVVCTVRIRAKVPGVRLYHAGFSYPGDQRQGVLTVEPIFGGTVAELRESPTGALAVYLLLDRDVDPGDPEPHVLSFRIRVDSDVRASPRLRYFADAGNERLTMCADLSAVGGPQAIWWFAASDVVDAEHSRPERRLKPDGGVYDWTFDRLVPGWCYGFAWAW